MDRPELTLPEPVDLAREALEARQECLQSGWTYCDDKRAAGFEADPAAIIRRRVDLSS
jgi:hypothetical protein